MSHRHTAETHSSARWQRGACFLSLGRVTHVFVCLISGLFFSLPPQRIQRLYTEALNVFQCVLGGFCVGFCVFHFTGATTIYGYNFPWHTHTRLNEGMSEGALTAVCVCVCVELVKSVALRVSPIDMKQNCSAYQLRWIIKGRIIPNPQSLALSN